MTELVKLIMDLLRFLNPFDIVWEWEQGCYYVFGYYAGTVGKGLKVLIPGVCSIRHVSIVPEIEVTPLQTITLRDKKTLTYSASLKVKVVNAYLAYNRVGHYSETVVELSSGIISSILAEADPERLIDPARKKRDNLLEEIRDELNENLKAYGMEVLSIRLNNFALEIPTYRLLLDTAVLRDKKIQPSLS